MARFTKDRTEESREYKRLWMQKRRAEFFDGKKCAKCKTEHNLELSYGPAYNRYGKNIMSYSAESKKVLTSKAKILCRECRVATNVKRRKPKCGTNSGYRWIPCRCAKCKAAHAAAARFYREQQRRAKE